MGESLCPIRCDAQRSPPVCAAQSLAVLSARSMSTREVFYEVLYRASLLGGLSLPASEVEVHAQGVARRGAHAQRAAPSSSNAGSAPRPQMARGDPSRTCWPASPGHLSRHDKVGACEVTGGFVAFR